MNATIGIDISKDKLDAYWLSNREHRQFCNGHKGVKAPSLWARETGITRVIFEPTGVYDRLLETGLAENGIRFAQVNPRQARRFCEGAGKLAKTDRVDAAMLVKMGALLELKAHQPKSEALHDLKQLATARLALIKDRTAERAQLASTTHKLLTLQIKRRLKQIERDLCQVADEIDSSAAADEDLAARAGILTSIPGIANVTACAILTDMPELGDLTGKQRAKLAGLASISEAIGKVARQGTNSGWPRQCQASHLSTCCRGNPLQPRDEGKIRATDIDRKMQEAGHHSRHAKADRYGQRTASGPEKMDAKPSLTNTDTHACSICCRQRTNTSMRRYSIP